MMHHAMMHSQACTAHTAVQNAVCRMETVCARGDTLIDRKRSNSKQLRVSIAQSPQHAVPAVAVMKGEVLRVCMPWASFSNTHWTL